MNLRILRTVHLPEGDLSPGATAELPDPVARLLIARGQAEKAAQAPSPAQAPAIASATAGKLAPKSPAVP